MLNDKCTWLWGHCLLFVLGQAPTPRLAAIMGKREPAPIDNRRNLPREVERDFCGLSMRRDEGHVVDPPLGFKKRFFGRREESPGWRELEESAKERLGGPSLEWKDDERRWRWRIGVT
ncbi:hypothetical protein TNCV_3956131 [Trichonephila clavipes]|nr:hypothetical protein TNCV_3956131 [Trichonephila clavipes]